MTGRPLNSACWGAQYVRPTKRVAYCNFHFFALTVRQMRIKKCRSRNCRHLRRNYEHTYWAQELARDRAREAKKKSPEGL